MRRITLDGNSAEQEHFHLIHVEQVLTQSTGPMEAVAALAMALLQDAEEEKSVLCDGNEAEAGNHCTLRQEVRGEKRYYRICTSSEYACRQHMTEERRQDDDEQASVQLAVSVDEFLGQLKENSAGILFNPGTSSELAVDPELVPFLQSMIRLSVNRETKKFFSDSEQVTEAAGQFTWD